MAVRVVRAMLMITLHLFFDSLVIVVIFLDFLRDVTVYAKDASAVDEDLGEDVEDTVVDFAGLELFTTAVKGMRHAASISRSTSSVEAASRVRGRKRLTTRSIS